jgi:DNA-binding FrmR family transcriptional regulator
MAARSSGCRKEGAAAVARALDRAGFKIIASGLCQCVLDEQAGRGDAAAERARLEKLFLALA